MRHSDYTAYFRGLAEKHTDFGHSPTSKHFARIILSVDEFGQSNVTEYVSGLRSAIKTPFLLLASSEDTYEDNQSDNIKKHQTGMFWLLTKPASDKFDSEEAAYDAMERTAEQFLAKMKKDFSERIDNRFYSLTETGISKVSQVDVFCGVRVSFHFFTTANAALQYDAAKWNS